MKRNWQPLIENLGRGRPVGFMYLARINGINLYKHGISRTYLIPLLRVEIEPEDRSIR